MNNEEKEIVNILRQIEAEELVRVVRCKDCKHFNADKEGTGGLCMRIMHGCQNWGFCADGEEKGR